MKDNKKNLMIRMLLCPEECNNSEVCMICPYCGQTGCVSRLKADAIETLKSESPESVRTQKSTSIDLKTRVTNIIHTLGIPAHIKGYHYVREAIVMVVKDMSIINDVTGTLYPKVAAIFDTTPSRVERAIRHAVETAWARGDLDTLQEWFGYTVSSTKGKPTNSEFIALIADSIHLDCRKEEK